MKAQHAPERIIPSETTGGPLASHLVRYDFAARYCEGRSVLDVACGVGYGSSQLAEVARSVVGVDLSADAIAYARRHYARRAAYARVDAHRLPFASKAFEAIVSFETLEHLPDPSAFLAEVGRVVADDGIVVLSTPRVDRTRHNPPENPYHVIEYSLPDLKRLLAAHFRTIEIFGQQRRQTRLHRWLQRADFLKLRTRLPRSLVNRAAEATGTTAWDDVDTTQFEIKKGGLEVSTEIVAVCSDPKGAKNA